MLLTYVDIEKLEVDAEAIFGLETVTTYDPLLDRVIPEKVKTPLAVLEAVVPTVVTAGEKERLTE
jgi:hypothetical protein